MLFTVLLPPRASHVPHPAARSRLGESSGEAFFCAVTEKFVTSNLNKSNLETECVTYV